jgi:chromosome segregation ATPase
MFWLLWFLPFLLGGLLTWLYWRNKYTNTVRNYHGKIKNLAGRIISLEGDLDDCGLTRTELERDLAITKGRMRELQAEVISLKNAAASKKETG